VIVKTMISLNDVKSGCMGRHAQWNYKPAYHGESAAAVESVELASALIGELAGFVSASALTGVLAGTAHM
jgi:hypothetical protein